MELFDAHCDTITRCYRHGWGLARNPGNMDLERVGEFGAYAQFFALFGDELKNRDLSREQIFKQEYEIFMQEIEKNGDKIAFCRTGGQVHEALAEKKTAALLSVEGADLIGCTIEGLEEAWKLGVRAINITWNYANVLSGTSAEEQDRGLSDLGKDYVRRMQELGMLVDVSHISDPGFWDIIELAKKPVMASHSNARTLCNDPRNLTDEMFTAIMKNGGVCGINMYREFLGEPYTVDRIVAHIEHFLSLGGERHVAMGGDWDGCYDEMPPEIVEIRDAEKIYNSMLQRNYSEDLVRAIFFKNMMRVVNEVCTM